MMPAFTDKEILELAEKEIERFIGGRNQAGDRRGFLIDIWELLSYQLQYIFVCISVGIFFLCAGFTFSSVVKDEVDSVIWVQIIAVEIEYFVVGERNRKGLVWLAHV